MLDKTETDILRQIGMSILASVPDTNHVYPLLGRPQDFLDSDDSQ